MQILSNRNFWEHLKKSIEKNAPKIVVAQTEEEETEEESPSVFDIINELGLQEKVNMLPGDYSDILLSEKVFEPELQSQIDSVIDAKTEEMKDKISNSEIVQNIEKLIRDLEKCKTSLDEVISEAVKSGKSALKAREEKFKPAVDNDNSEDGGM